MKDQRHLKALVVEDQEMFRLAMADELRFLGFDVETAENGELGLQAALANPFDLILSDIRMPVRDGQWFLEQYRKVHPTKPPFIFMTGFADLSPPSAFGLGADGFAAKPINQDDLEKIIKRLCQPDDLRWTTPSLTPPKHSIVLKCKSIDSDPNVQPGRSGVFIKATDESHRVGDTVAFHIQFETGSILQLDGVATIAWRRVTDDSDLLAGIGLDFIYLDKGSLDPWRAFLAARKITSTIPPGKSTLAAA